MSLLNPNPKPNQQTNRPLSDSNSSILILVYTRNRNDSENKLSFCRFPNFDDRSVINIDLPKAQYFDLHIIGHSHGIYCLSDARRDVFLCNPNTCEFRKLPPSTLLNDYSQPIALGFGYDPKSNDFKVVRVVTFVDPPYHYHPSRVELYDLSTDQWREIKTCVPGYFVLHDSLEISHNGFYYSLALNHNYESILISFDMTEEIFRQVPLPDCFNGTDLSIRRFGVLNESVVLFLFTWSDEGELHIWEMENIEYGVIFWSKIYIITSIPDFWTPLLFVNSHELLLYPYTSTTTMISYNVITKEFKTHPKQSVKGGRKEYFIFEKSSLSVKGGRKESAPL